MASSIVAASGAQDVDLNASTSSNLSCKEESSERDDEDCYADVGFMFEGHQPSTLKRFRWVRESSNNNNNQQSHTLFFPEVRVALHLVDDEPGALQSGHYLWPAAQALAEFLIQTSQQQQQKQQRFDLSSPPSTPTRSPSTPTKRPRTLRPHNILELGAGCALVSLTALQLFATDQLQCVVITDHDPGTLERARDNYETTLEDLLESTETEEEQFDCINQLTSIPVLFEPLEWGNAVVAQQVAMAATEHCSPLQSTVPMSPRTPQSSSPMADPGGMVVGPFPVAPPPELVMPQLKQLDHKTEIQHTEKRVQPMPMTPTSPATPESPFFFTESHIFDLIMGSDLIVSKTTVELLLRTVSVVLAPHGMFILAQSCGNDPETEQAMDDVCQSLHLQRTVLVDDASKEGDNAVRIQQFVWKRHRSMMNRTPTSTPISTPIKV